MKTFSKSEAIKLGWRTTLDNFWFFVAMIVAYYVIPTFVRSAGMNIKKSAWLLGSLVVLVAWLLSYFANIGSMRNGLSIVAGTKPKVKDLIEKAPVSLNFFLKSIGLAIIYGLIVLVGFILLIIPGFVWAIKYKFALLVMIEKNTSIGESLKQSAAITYGAKWNLFFFGIILCLINILGAIPFGIGLLITLPLSIIAYISVYKKLSAQTN